MARTPTPKRSKATYPKVALSKVLDLVKVIFELGDGEPIRRVRVFDSLGQSPDSRGSRDSITSSNSGYGLTTGGYQAEFLSLTALGRRVLLAPDERHRMEALYDALFRNALFADIVAHFNQKSIRTNEVAIDYLRKQHQLAETEAEASWHIMRLNMYENGLIAELAGKEIIITREQAQEHWQQLMKSPASEPPAPQPSIKDLPPIEKGIKDGHQNLPFSLQIQITADTRPETIDHLFANIARYFGSQPPND